MPTHRSQYLTALLLAAALATPAVTAAEPYEVRFNFRAAAEDSDDETTERGVQLSASTLDFGILSIGDQDTRSIQVNNPGPEPARLVAIDIVNPVADGSVFSSTTTCSPGQELPAGQSCQVDVRAAPANEGVLEGWLRVTDSLGQRTAQLRVQTGEPSASVDGEGNAGVVFVNETKSLAFTVTNTGTGAFTPDVSISAPGESSAFQVSEGTSTCNSVLAAGASCTVNVNVNPTVTGEFIATLEVAGAGETGVSQALSATAWPRMGITSVSTLYGGAYVTGTGLATMLLSDSSVPHPAGLTPQIMFGDFEVDQIAKQSTGLLVGMSAYSGGVPVGVWPVSLDNGAETVTAGSSYQRPYEIAESCLATVGTENFTLNGYGFTAQSIISFNGIEQPVSPQGTYGVVEQPPLPAGPVMITARLSGAPSDYDYSQEFTVNTIAQATVSAAAGAGPERNVIDTLGKVFTIQGNYVLATDKVNPSLTQVSGDLGQLFALVASPDGQVLYAVAQNPSVSGRASVYRLPLNPATGWMTAPVYGGSVNFSSNAVALQPSVTVDATSGDIYMASVSGGQLDITRIFNISSTMTFSRTGMFLTVCGKSVGAALVPTGIAARGTDIVVSTATALIRAPYVAGYSWGHVVAGNLQSSGMANGTGKVARFQNIRMVTQAANPAYLSISDGTTHRNAYLP